MKIPLVFASGILIAALTGPVSSGPSSLPFTVTQQQFEAGDSITLTRVVAPSAEFKTGDTVAVSGRYTLRSRPSASLGFYLTTNGPSVPTPIAPDQIEEVTKGSGTFELKQVISAEGSPHVSFYPAKGGASFGGVYFTTVER